MKFTRIFRNVLVSPAWVMMLVCCAAAPASAQSFNIDINSTTASPPLGGGVPSSGFGGTANQVGVWNSMATSGPISLFDLSGAVTSVSFAITATSTSNSILAFNNPANTGDFALLLNDGSQIGTTTQGGSRTYQFSGLQNGLYSLYTYGARPQGIDGELFVNVLQSNDGTQTITGVPPGNAFVYGMTHVVHSVNVVSGIATIQLSDNPGAPAAYVNGFQLVQVPAPGVLGLLAVLPIINARRRR